MIKQTQIETLVELFRLPSDLKVTGMKSQMAGRSFTLESKSKNDVTYLLQFFETMHTKSQIETDLNLLRTMGNLAADVYVPLISKEGEMIDSHLLGKPIALFCRRKEILKKQTVDSVYTLAQELSMMHTAFNEKKYAGEKGKKIDSIFTMFELALREEYRVEETFKSEYYAFKANFISLLNQETKSTFAFLPSENEFYLTKENRFGMTSLTFLYDMPVLYSLAQLVLATCFNNEGQLDFNLLDAATAGYSTNTLVIGKDWNNFDQVLKNAAFLEVLCNYLNMIYHPNLIFVDALINARTKQKHLIKFVLKEAL